MQLDIDDLGVCGVVVDDWALEKSFKPKTITTDYTSWIAYISRRPVPANTPITDTYYWKPLTRLQAQLAFNYEIFKEYVEARLKSMDIEIQSFLQSVAGGTAVTDRFGDSELVAVNQKAVTEAINNLWSKIEDITGEAIHGIVMTVTPEYYIGENGATVTINANTANTNGIFEHIEFQINGIKVCEDDNVDTFSYETEINETVVIKCVAKILGIEYTQQKIVTHYSSFWLGCGSVYTDVMDGTSRCIITISHHMRGAYDVTAEAGDHIFVIVGESLAERFIRADMNGMEIEFTSATVTVDGNNYVVFTSVNTYNAGTYNVDING